MVKRKQIAFRTTEVLDLKLAEIEATMSMTRQDVLNNLIAAEYDRIMGNPQLMEILKQMNDLKSQLEIFGKGGKDVEEK